jgi:hypothetical protein
MENTGRSRDVMPLQPRYHVVHSSMCRVATGFSFDDFDNDNLLNFTEKRMHP